MDFPKLVHRAWGAGGAVQAQGGRERSISLPKLKISRPELGVSGEAWDHLESTGGREAEWQVVTMVFAARVKVWQLRRYCRGLELIFVRYLLANGGY